MTSAFGPVEEERGPGRPKVGEQVCFTVPSTHLALLDAMAEQQGVGRSFILRAAVASYVNARNPETPGEQQ